MAKTGATIDSSQPHWLQFDARIQIRGINPYVRVDAARAARLKDNWRRPMPVLVHINGSPDVPWRINMMPAGNGDFYLYLHETIRKASGTKVGDRVAVEVRFDPEYRSGPTHPMPAWFRKALASNATAHSAWEALIPSRQKEVLRYFAQLKSPAAQERNLERAMAALSGKTTRFMARTWRDGK